MVDIQRWNKCSNESPKKKGKYKLMIGKRSSIGGWLNINIIVGIWNGHVWSLDTETIPIKWSYLKPSDNDKYPQYVI